MKFAQQTPEFCLSKTPRAGVAGVRFQLHPGKAQFVEGATEQQIFGLGVDAAALEIRQDDGPADLHRRVVPAQVQVACGPGQFPLESFDHKGFLATRACWSARAASTQAAISPASRG